MKFEIAFRSANETETHGHKHNLFEVNDCTITIARFPSRTDLKESRNIGKTVCNIMLLIRSDQCMQQVLRLYYTQLS